MNEIWANRLIAGTKKWADMPPARQKAVKEILASGVKEKAITESQYKDITGEDYAA